MNIGVDIRCLMNKQRTGVGEYTYSLLNSLFEIDKENNYFLFFNSCKNVSANIPKWQPKNVHYIFTRWPNKLLNLLVWLRFIKLDRLVTRHLERSETKSKDLLVEKDSSTHPLKKGFAQNDEWVWFSPNLNFTSLSRHVKHILTIHDLSFEFFPEYFTFKQRLWHKFLNPKKQCQRADIILTPSENTRRDIVNGYQLPDSKIQVLRPGISVERGTGNGEQVKQKYNLPEKYILFLGTLEPRKNVESVIEAYKRLTPPYPPLQGEGKGGVSLVIAGGSCWKNKKLMKMIAETEGVRYLGYVSEEDKPVLYQSASLFVFPSFYEGFGLPVLEAMAAGVPVITSNCSSLPEVVGEAGYLVNPHNVLEIAEAMKAVLLNEELSSILVSRGNERAKKFDLSDTENFIKINLGLI